MSDATVGLLRKLESAGDLRSVVRTMRALAAANIGQYERSVRALSDYFRTVELGLGMCFRQFDPTTSWVTNSRPLTSGTGKAIVFGSDQGLVGQFNETVAEHALKAFERMPAPPTVWVVGERVHARLTDSGVSPAGLFAVPASVEAITTLVGQLLLETAPRTDASEMCELHLFFNRPHHGASYVPDTQRLLPLDAHWCRMLAARPWPSNKLPEFLGEGRATLGTFIREYIFVSLFRACAGSLASENASRLAAMQRADRNINELLDELLGAYHRLRQSSIDAELFDVTSGFEAVTDR